tara:strand:- start:74 stop:418 length:345 start_codon:yes stop_codon:yes gene_type:complete
VVFGQHWEVFEAYKKGGLHTHLSALLDSYTFHIKKVNLIINIGYSNTIKPMNPLSEITVKKAIRSLNSSPTKSSSSIPPNTCTTLTAIYKKETMNKMPQNILFISISTHFRQFA